MTGGQCNTPAGFPRVRDDLIFRQLDEEWVVYDSMGQQLHVLNGTAALVWLHCTGHHSIREIANVLGEVFDLDLAREPVERDVQRTIAEFAKKGLLE
jgi:hypothetical protein